MRRAKRAFTLLEVVFVIAIIGILASIAIPKLAVTRNDALDARGKSILQAVRNAISMERQKRIMRGDFTSIGDLGESGGRVFTHFDGNSSNPVLEYPPKECTDPGCWERVNATTYIYHATGGVTCTYTLQNNKFVLQSGTTCAPLEE